MDADLLMPMVRAFQGGRCIAFLGTSLRDPLRVLWGRFAKVFSTHRGISENSSGHQPRKEDLVEYLLFILSQRQTYTAGPENWSSAI